MTGVKPDERIRTPMQWSSAPNAGFTTGLPWEELNQGFDLLNVAAQQADPDSLWNTYKSLIQLRNATPALRSANAWFPDTGDSHIYAALRVTTDQALLVLINLHSEPVSEYSLNLESSPLSGSFVPVALLGGESLDFPRLITGENGAITNYLPLPELPANAIVVLELQP